MKSHEKFCIKILPTCALLLLAAGVISAQQSQNHGQGNSPVNNQVQNQTLNSGQNQSVTTKLRYSIKPRLHEPVNQPHSDNGTGKVE